MDKPSLLARPYVALKACWNINKSYAFLDMVRSRLSYKATTISENFSCSAFQVWARRTPIIRMNIGITEGMQKCQQAEA